MQKKQTCRLKWRKMQLRGHWNFAGEGHLQHALAALLNPATAFAAVKLSIDVASCTPSVKNGLKIVKLMTVRRVRAKI